MISMLKRRNMGKREKSREVNEAAILTGNEFEINCQEFFFFCTLSTVKELGKKIYAGGLILTGH